MFGDAWPYLESIMMYENLFKACPDSPIKRSSGIQIVAAFQIQKHISIRFFLLFQEILSVAKKSKVENQVRWQMLQQFKHLEPKRREEGLSKLFL